ncbi:hypothetical protein [Corynebacterium sp. A21]|uniref:hypothetical protein n=1 Tax=Corynebacterium sp. A21 TaxID=3457318 RepID=UPI003FD6AC14
MVVKPHDPRQFRITPEQVKSGLDTIFSEEPADLSEEAEQLRRAHEVLYDALQEG